MQLRQADLDAIIQDIITNLPEFLRATDLISCGLFKTRSDVSWAMKRGLAPPSIKLSQHKIIFPRASLCEWLKEKTKNSPEKINLKVKAKCKQK
jgi:hypothetical protein